MPPKKKSTPKGAQLNASTRARVDKSRKVGNANAVASGVDMSRVGIISDRELMWIRRLAFENDEEEVNQRTLEEQRRKQLSNQHKAGWTDTVEARHDNFLKKQEQEKEEAERRRQALDELYNLEEEEKKREANARLELQTLLDDPRGRNVKSAKILHETLQAQEKQIEENKLRREAENVDRQRELDEIIMKNWGDNAEEMRLTLERKQKELDIKNANMEMLKGQIEERKKQRLDEKGERLRVRQEAEEEAEENRLETEERRQKELYNSTFNKSNARKATTKAQKLDTRKAEDMEYERKRQEEEERLEQMKQSAYDARNKKQQRFENRKKVGIDAYVDETSNPAPKYRTQEVFENKGTSFLDRMYQDDSTRVQRSKELRKPQEEEAMASGTESWRSSQHRKAEATATGYLTKEEEAEHLAEMRTYPERVKAEMDAEEAERLAEARRIKGIQRMQADEKHANERAELEQLREEARLQREREALDDAEYAKFIDSQLPGDAKPIVRKRAHAP
ncbi:hypothetical protein AGDE_00899 [Angomonas deanei]|nr:hypothetical protein AGDE_11782 [Angomonas deanei]EPY43024.1 hypothetical protein AGDE_00899 [Angomonas deanei]|eukprot:EPY25425.1 hypothetical protein AGDE_11782 [Angomonas deanei]